MPCPAGRDYAASPASYQCSVLSLTAGSAVTIAVSRPRTSCGSRAATCDLRNARSHAVMVQNSTNSIGVCADAELCRTSGLKRLDSRLYTRVDVFVSEDVRHSDAVQRRAASATG